MITRPGAICRLTIALTRKRRGASSSRSYGQAANVRGRLGKRSAQPCAIDAQQAVEGGRRKETVSWTVLSAANARRRTEQRVSLSFAARHRRPAGAAPKRLAKGKSRRPLRDASKTGPGSGCMPAGGTEKAVSASPNRSRPSFGALNRPLSCARPRRIERAISAFARQPNGGLIVTAETHGHCSS